MRILQLNLANFRGFGQIELSFEEDVTVIAGVNGIGKSGILQAIATLFSQAQRFFTPSNAPKRHFEDDDIRFDTMLMQMSVTFRVADNACSANLRRIRETDEERTQIVEALERIRQELGAIDQPERERRLRERQSELRRSLSQAREGFNLLLQDVQTDAVRTGELDAVERETRRIYNSLRSRKEQPLTVFYSTERRLAGRPRTLPARLPFDMRAAYTDALTGGDVQLREFMYWFRVQEDRAVRGDVRARRIVDVLREAVTAFVPEFQGLRIEDGPPVRLVVEKETTPLWVDQLSDGERGLLAMVLDLARRLAIANPEVSDPNAEGRAIVLIDEIELHLHPAWQRRVLARFRTTFPRCQFIVTTHSPQVIGEAEARCVRFLVREEYRTFPWTPSHAFGLDTNRVLGELMEVEERDPGIASELRAVFNLIDEDNFETAEELIDQIEARVGSGEPELTRARSLIAFLTGAE